jgi:hypothetical protein
MKIPLQSWEPWVNPGERFKHVEIQINTACDLACFSCDRMSDVVTDANMTLDQVKLFVAESIDLDWDWERIRILGGEPTLHPRFKDMIGWLVGYREWLKIKHGKGVFLQVLTNGWGQKSAELRPWVEEQGVSFHAERKQEGVDPPWFLNTRVVPLDRDPEVGELPPCLMFGIRSCGIGLTRWGFFLDGAGATVARVAGLDVGVMRLQDVTWQAMLDQARVLCRVCGHWNPIDATEQTRLNDLVSVSGKVTGKFWTEQLAAFHENRPVMRVYGQEG